MSTPYPANTVIPSGVESTPEKSVGSEELFVAGGRNTTIEGETNTIYSSLASCGQMTKDQSIEETLNIL